MNTDKHSVEALWAPWRLEYIRGAREEGCIFCERPRSANDAENLILARGEWSFVMMNLYPYNNGHLMVVPYRHAARLREVEPSCLEEVMVWAQACERVLEEAVCSEGFNLGINLGQCAGAGIDGHLHLHVVPRWSGDTNFMPVLADVKSVPDHINRTYADLQPLFARAAKELELGGSSHFREEM